MATKKVKMTKDKLLFEKIKRYCLFLCDLQGIGEPIVFLQKRNKVYNLDMELVKEVEMPQNVKGKFFYKDNTVFINLDLHFNDEEFLSLTHEFRHVYQYQAIQAYENGDCWEDEALLKRWKQNFSYPKTSLEKNYADQPLELDAFAFAEFISKVVFRRMMNFNEEHDHNQYLNILKKIERDFSIEEIIDALSYSRFDKYIL